jgi:hypothetical protein
MANEGFTCRYEPWLEKAMQEFNANKRREANYLYREAPDQSLDGLRVRRRQEKRDEMRQMQHNWVNLSRLEKEAKLR